MVEESDAGNVIAPPGGPASKPAPEDDGDGEDDGDDGNDASARRTRYRAQRRAAQQQAMRVALEASAKAKATALLKSAAGRLARRITKDAKMPGADVIAEALAIETAAAQRWIDATHAAAMSEDQLIASLMTLGKPE
jgi:hypothetical protein